MSHKKTSVYFSNKRIDWETPAYVFDPLDAIYKFTLDVCATAETAKCKRYFTKHNDGLLQSWEGQRCWMNPPYGREIKDWVAKASEEGDENTIIVGLLPARTDTRWWHDYVIPEATSVTFRKGRVRFVGAPTGAPFPSAVVVWGGRVP